MPERLRRKIRRQEQILSTLADLTYATSGQINEIERLGSDRNIRRILFEMESDKLIASLRREKKVYYVIYKGSDFIGRNNPRLKQLEIDHALLRNDLYIRLGCPKDWRKEVPININGEKALVADAVFTKGNVIYFVEVDNRTSMQTNNSKIKKYAKVFRGLNRPATLVWYTLIKSRKDKLRDNCERAGVSCRIYG